MIPELEEIKRLLLWEWDPIGVAGIEGAVDEYDMYAMPIFTGLHSGATVDDITDYLERVAIERMGLNGDAAKARRVAAKIVELHSTR